MDAASPASMRTAAMTLLVTAAAGGCAEILGLDDPAGRLEGTGGATASAGGTPTSSSGAGAGAGSTVTGAGGGGAGGGPASTGGGPGSTTSTGAGGGAIEGTAVALPEGFTVEVLGRSPAGAVALVKRGPDAAGVLCGMEVDANRLVAVSISDAPCAVLGQVEGPGTPLEALSIEQNGDWLGLTGRSEGGTVTLRTPSELPATVPTGGGFFGLWNLTDPEQGDLLATYAALHAGRILPTVEGSADLLWRASQYGFSPDFGGDCSIGADGAQRVHFAHTTLAPSCSQPRLSVEGSLLDAGRGGDPWALVRSPVGVCDAMVAATQGEIRLVGGCNGAVRMLVADDGGEDRTFVGMTRSSICRDRPGITEATSSGPDATWCDPDAGADADVRVVPFHLDATHLHFVRADQGVADDAGAALWKVPREGGDAVMTAELCTGCVVRDAVAGAGAVHVIGDATAPIELFGEAITLGGAFWARVSLSDL